MAWMSLRRRREAAMQQPLLDPIEIRKLVVELVGDVIAKPRPIPHTRETDYSGMRWWGDSNFQGEIMREIETKIADWLEFRLARS